MAFGSRIGMARIRNSKRVYPVHHDTESTKHLYIINDYDMVERVPREDVHFVKQKKPPAKDIAVKDDTLVNEQLTLF